MADFFRGWKRKMGMGTLVMACVFLAGWIRSQSITDIVEWTNFTVVSIDSRVAFCVANSHATLGFPTWRTVAQYSLEPELDDSTVGYRFAGAGFALEFFHFNCTLILFAPYWFVILPLTLLAAGLLLSKPHRGRAVE